MNTEDIIKTHLNSIPQYLYHYTSIEGLAHILKSKRIKFTALTEMDDKLEGVLEAQQQVRKYIFSSSWTDIERENIPFWNMYAGQMKGVRIKLPSLMFDSYKYDISEQDINGISTKTVESFLKKEQIFGSDYIIQPMSIYTPFFLSKIIYDDNYPVKDSLFSPNGKSVIIDFDKWGKIKTKDWAFQSEWRFRLLVFPVDYSLPNAFENSGIRMLEEKDISLREVFVDISTTAFEQMEILIGPKCSIADKIIIESLVKEWNPKALIVHSSLQIK